MIYNFALVNAPDVPVDRKERELEVRSGLRVRLELTLFSVCKEISQEAIAHFYSKNVFRFETMDTPAKFLRQIGQSRHHIRSVRIIKITCPSVSARLLQFLTGTQKLANLRNLTSVSVGEGTLDQWVFPWYSRTKHPIHLVHILAPVFISIHRRNGSCEEALKAFGFESLWPVAGNEICCDGNDGLHIDDCANAGPLASRQQTTRRAHARSLKRAVIACIDNS